MAFRFVLLALLASTHTLVAQSPALAISRLTADMYVFTTWQLTGGSRFPANGLYVLTDSGAVLLDTPWDPTQFQPLLDSIRVRHGQRVVLCLATHAHDDRTGGLAYYAQQGISTYTSRMTDSISQVQGDPRATRTFRQDTIFQVGQYSFDVYYGGPGHSPDNVVVWIPQTRLLYGGCLIKSTEATHLGNLADANVSAWPATLRHIRQRWGAPRYVIPGHQDWTDPHSPQHTLKLLRAAAKSR
ncbi:MAG: BlaB/IND/MUS family subclass B1 metallo-beta-lactamase [Bacteroidia bacterium]|nr:BlaB/IND/MUS family subclass B1 metallo-beta-lactamase [Bacteroidia bacterium]